MKLKIAIKGLDGKEITEVRPRLPILVSDMMYVAEHCPNDRLEGVYTVARMTGLDIKEIEGMCLEDFNALSAAVMGKDSGPDGS